MPAKKKPTPALGNKVKDTISGFTGHVVAISHRPSSTTMYGVQPLAKKGAAEFPKATYIDEITLEVIGKGVPVSKADPNVLIGLGDQVEDTVTGLVGITTERVTFVNGCVHFMVMGRLPADKKEPPSLFLQHTRLKLLMPATAMALQGMPQIREQPSDVEAAGPKPEPLLDNAHVSRPGGPSRDVIRP